MYEFNRNVIVWIKSTYFVDVKCQKENESKLICSNLQRDTDAQRDMKSIKNGKMNARVKTLDASTSDWQLPCYQSTCHVVLYVMIRALANYISHSITKVKYFFNEH